MRTIVIGSGIVGAATAHHLAAAGSEVIVVDEGHPGRATAAGAGIVCPWTSAVDDGPYFDLYAAGARHYDELVPALAAGAGGAIGYRRVGALVVSDDDADLDEAESRLARRAVGRPEVGAVHRLDGSEARLRFPPLRPGVGALHIAGGARVDGRLLATALVESAVAAGADVRRGRAAPVVRDGRAVGVLVAGEEIGADRVIVAGGAWTNEFLAPLGLAVDVEPQKGQIVHLGLDVVTRDWPVVLPPGPSYLLSFDDSRVVVGATRETGSGFDTRVTAGGQAEVLNAALAVAPGLADARIIETRVGLRPLARGLPTIGEVPTCEGLIVGTGLGAGGLTIGPLVGQQLAALAVGGQPSLDLSPFAPTPRES